jgi:hypothetical protein
MRKITKVELEEFRLDINKWVATGDDKEDKEMVKTYTADRKDLKKILELIESGNYKRASQRIYKLDTLIRDQIPRALYNEIMQYYV